MIPRIKKDVLLSDYTTIGLGGKAKYFFECKSENDVLESLTAAKKNNIDVQIISGGSNLIFSDKGFDGLVLKIDLKGIVISENENFFYVKTAAGEIWDDFVKLIIDRELSGIECLSGIPGSVGATPIQNVGAYGQEVSDVITCVGAIDIQMLTKIQFENNQCEFDYRQSRFKNSDKDKFIITDVTFAFQKNKIPEIKYSELLNFININSDFSPSNTLSKNLNIIRKSVLALRKKKSMIVDDKDPNSKSCGSFFMNPVMSENEFNGMKLKLQNIEIPFYKSGNNYKIPAAFVVEQSGFHKGYRRKGAGISCNHSLALINIDGTTNDLLELSDEIEKQVDKKFGIKLMKEPVIVPFRHI